MDTTKQAGINSYPANRLQRWIALLAFSFLTMGLSYSQPLWVGGTPSVSNVGPLSVQFNYGINMTGTVYVIIFNSNVIADFTPLQVKNFALAGPSGGRVVAVALPIVAGQVNIPQSIVFDLFDANRAHALYCVAESSGNVLQGDDTRINLAPTPSFTTLACPDVKLQFFFINNGECVNSGAQGIFGANPIPFTPTGVLKGTRWTVDWGDGSPVYTYISTADNDIPIVPPHNFTSLVACNYVGTYTVENPCGKFTNGSTVFVVHGRDIPTDGDGELLIVDAPTGTPNILYVCEGQEYDIVLRDASTWNCQSPVVPLPLTAKPNIDPRTLQWIYGETPGGAVMNTIAGNVMVAGVNMTNAANGWEGPVNTGQTAVGLLSDTITIPATSVVGQRYYVYLKNWNKCNPYGGNPAVNYEYTEFIIEIIDAPDAPIVPLPQFYCFDTYPTTISATPNTAGNTIRWYANADKTGYLNTGLTYTHGQSAPGTYTFYAAETSISNTCEGPTAPVTFTIKEELTRPGPITGPAEVCLNATNVVFSVAADPPVMPIGGPTEYVWSVPAGWVIVSGQGTKQLTVNIGGTAGSRTVSVRTRYTTAPTCQTNTRDHTLTVSPLTVGGAVVGGTTPLCIGSATGNMTLAGHTGSVVQWERRLLPSAVWTTVANTTTTYNYTPPSVGTWEFRALVQSGSCSQVYSTARQIVVVPLSVGGTTSGGSSPICIGSGTGNITVSGYTGSIVRWQRKLGAGAWTDIAGTAGMVTYSETPASAGTWQYRAQVTSSPCATAFSTETTIVVDPATVGGSVGGGTTPLCLGSSTGAMTLAGHTGSVVRWERRVGGAGPWTTIVNTTTTHTETPATAGSWEFRAVVKSGACAEVNSAARTIVVSPLSVGGTTSGGNSPICQGSGTGNISVAGYTGSIVRWQRRLGAGAWTDIAGTAGMVTYSETPASAGTWQYRAQITSSPCATAFSTETTIVVDPTTVPGSVTGGTTPICIGANTGVMTLAGHTGSVVKWQKRLGAGAWSDIVNTTTTYSEVPVSAGTWEYRAVVKSGTCLEVNSASRSIVVNPASVGGSVTGGSSPICYGVNTGVMTLSGHTGTILRWQKRLGAGAWTDITNTTTTYSEVPTASGTWQYRAEVQSGVCASAFSAAQTIIVHPRFQLAQLMDNASICANTSTNFYVALTGGTSPYTINYTRNGVPQAAIPGYISGNNIPTGILATGTYTYALTSVTDANGCPVESLGTSIAIVVGSTPSAALLTGNGDVCLGSESFIRLTITGGAPPYAIKWSLNGVPQADIAGYTSGTDRSIGFLAVNNYSVTIQEVKDACNATVPGAGLPGAYNFRVDPIPNAAGTVVNTPSICYDGTTDIVLQSTVASTNFSWTVSNAPAVTWVVGKAPAAGTINNGNGLSIAQQLAHTGTAPVVVTYTITPTGPGGTACPGLQITRNVTVNPRPTLTSSLTPPAICSNTAFSYTPTSATAGTTFNWSRAAVGGISNPANTGTGNPNETLINTTAAPVTVTYAYTLAANGCSNVQNVQVVVNPTPTLTSSLTPPAICSNTAFSYTPTSATGGTTFNWSRAAVGGISNPANTGTGNPNETLINTTAAPVTVTYVYTLAANGCSNVQNVQVVVNPRPTLTSSLTPPAICSNTAFSYTPTSATVGTTFNWSRAAVGGISNPANTGTGNPNETLINTTAAPVTVTYAYTLAANGCSNVQNVQVVVNPTPTLTSSLTPPAICSNTAFSYTPTSATVGTTFNWSRAAVGGISNPANTGTGNPNETLINTTAAPVTVTYVYTLAANGCSNVQNVQVVVNPRPTLTSSLTPPAICSNTAFSYTPTSATVGTTFNWSRAAVGGISNPANTGTGNPNETLINTTAAPVTVTYAYTLAANGCSNVQNVQVVVNPTPTLTSSLTPPAICSNTAFSYTPTSATVGTTFNWSRAAVGGISNPANTGTGNPNETLINTTAAPVTVTYVYTLAANGCSNVQNVQVVVNPRPTLTSSLTPPAICSNTAFSYTPTSATVGTTFNWSRAAVGGISNPANTGTGNPNETLINTTAAPVTVTYAYTLAANGCSNVQNVQVVVNPTPTLTSSLTPPAICSNTAFSYTPTSATVGTTFNWSRAAVGGISNPANTGTGNPNETLINTTAAPVTVTYVYTLAANGCSNVQNVQVVVNPRPTLTSSLTPPAICSNTSFSYTPTSATVGTTFNWTRAVVPGITNPASGGAGNPNEVLVNTLTVPVTVTYVYTLAANGCSNVQNVQVVVNPTPVLSTTLTPADVCSNTVFSNTASSLTAGTTYTWSRAAVGGIENAANGGAGATITETLRNRTGATIPVTYAITLTANGCSNVQNVVVNVKPEPVVAPAQGPSVCSGESLNHEILLSNLPSGSGTTFTWPAPTLSAGLTGGTARAVPSSANMTATFVNTSGGAETATYFVTPYYNGCQGETQTIIVTVGSQPVLDPNLNDDVCSALPIGLVLGVDVGSVPATGYDIASITVAGGLVAGGGNVPQAAANNVAANYLSNDVFTNETGTDKTVVYRVRPLFGATCIGDWVDITITIKPQPVILPGQTAEICSSTPVNKQIVLVPANTPAGTLFNWGLPLMSDASVQGTAGVNVPAGDPLHITDVLTNYSAAPITATYTITPVSAFGCSGTPRTVIVTVKPEPAAPVVTGRDKLCIGETNIVYTIPLTPGSSYTWTVPASVGTKIFDFNTNAIIVNAAAAAGSGNILVTETNSFGCTGVAGIFPVTVMAPSAVSTPAGDNSVCALETASYSIPFNAGSTYQWTLPAGAFINGDPSASTISVTWGLTGGNVSVRETNAAGCITNHTPLAVTINPLPTATISGSGTVCMEDTHPINVTFTGTGPWNFTYAINGAAQAPVIGATSPHVITAAAPGNYTIVSVTDANGCNGTGTGNATVTYFPKPTGQISGTTAICNGGSAVLSVSLTGTAPFTFTYTDGVTPVTITNHPTTLYTVSVSPSATTTYTMVSLTDGNGCDGLVSGSAVITVNAQPTLAFAVTNLLCFGDNSGAIDLTVTGAATYSVAWTGPDGFTANVDDISGLKAGQYNVTVTSSDGCVATGMRTVTQPTVLSLASTGNIVLLCNGDLTGAGSFTAAGGTAPYVFTTVTNTTGGTITTAAPLVSFTGAGAGTITIRVTDVNNCFTESTVTITQPAALTLTGTLSLSAEGSHNINCFGGNTGSIALNVAGGVAPYTYLWSTVGGSGLTPAAANQTGLTAGSYTVIVTDANGCTITDTWTLTQPTALTVNAITDDALIGTCALSDAQLTATPAGGVPGVPGYTYSWSPAAGLSATNIANPVAKPSSTTTYTVTVTDANGCIAQASVLVAVAPPLTAVTTATDNNIGTCPTSTTVLTATPSGGEGPYTYLWDNAGTLSDATSATPTAKPPVTTTYTVTVTDANGCTTTSAITITVAPALAVSVTATDLLIGTCASSTSTLTAGVTGGQAPYTYSWDNGATLSAANIFNPVAKPLANTTYTVTVTDANGCQATGSITISVAPPLTVAANTSDALIGTCGTSVANLTAVAAGGEEFGGGGYTYSWAPATGLSDPNIANPVAKPLATTTYTVTVTDANGCQATANVVVAVAPVLSVSAVATDYNIGTCLSSVSNITATAVGGEGPYTYLWDNAATLSDATSSTPVAKPLVGTTYTLTVTDANGCTATTTITINVRPDLSVTASASDLLIGTCAGSESNLSAVATGGETAYTYSWAPAAGLSATNVANPVAKPLATTTYTVTVTDNNGCTATASVTITVADPLAAVVTASDLLTGTCAASVSNLDVTVTGGEGPFSYSWAPVAGLNNPFIKTPTAKPAVTTTYTVTVTDANGCTTTANITITVAPPVTVTATTSDNIIGTCAGSEATLTATAGGGEPGYTYQWSPAAGLSADNISNPVAKPAVTTTYTVIVTDQNGCTATANVTVTVAPVLTATATASDLNIGTCASSTSTLNVVVSGGEAPYTYLWDNAGTLSNPAIANPVAKPLATTTYTVTVTDANNCTTTAQVTIVVAPPVTAVATATDLLIGTCPSSRSTLDVTAGGGEPGYTYSWLPVAGLNDPLAKNPIAKPAVTTTYTVTVTDANGCTATADVTITVASDLTVTAIADDYILSTCPTSDAQLTATAGGGEMNYVYSWAPAAGLSATNIPNPVAKPLSTTTYTVTVTDENGCVATAQVTIEVRPALSATATASDLTIGTCVTSTSTLNVTVTGGEMPYTYLWDNAATLSNPAIANPVAKPLVTTTYTVTVTDVNGCSTTAQVTINVAPALSVTASVVDPLIGTCPSSNTQITASASGGEGPYTYSWDNAGFLSNALIANPVAKPPVTTLFTVTVTDVNGCTATAQVTVNVAPDLTAVASATDLLIGTCPTSVSTLGVVASGGEELGGGGYTYSWAPAAGLNYTNVQNPVAKPAVTSTYTVTVTDANGCTTTAQVTITVAAPLTVGTVSSLYAGGWNISCFGATDGDIDLTINGGEGPFVVSWTGPGGFTSASQDIVNLAAGTYNLTVTDANGCTATTTVNMLEPAVVVLGRTADVLLACNGDNTGTGSFSVSGGTAPYTFNVLANTAGATITSPTGTSRAFTGGSAGVVTIQVIDANGCSDIATITITEPPVLTPGSVDGDQEVCFGGDPTLLGEVTAAAGGPAAILYQWERATAIGGPYTAIGGASTATYDPPSGLLVTTYYRRRATSGTCAPVYTNIVTVTVNPLPVASIAGAGFVCPGDPATLTVTVTTGTGLFTVVLSDGTTVLNYASGAPITVNPLTTTTYTITSVTDSKGCAVSAPHANLTGSATISVKVVPEILVQPVAVSVCEGQNAVFTVDPGSTTNPLYQWYVDRNDGFGPQTLPGETGASLTVAAVSSFNGYRYSVVVSGDCPVAVTSNQAVLTVSELPEIITQPVAVTICAGEDAVYTVDAGVTTAPTYTWYVNTGSGWNIAVGPRYTGTYTNTLTVAAVIETMTGYQYKVAVGGTCLPAVESVAVGLTVTRQAEITQQPLDVTLCEGQNASFTVNAGLTTGPTYQWQLFDGVVWNPLPGETNATLSLTAVTSAMNGNRYRVVVSSTCGSFVNSNAVVLTVNELPEILVQPVPAITCENNQVEFTVDAGVTTGVSYRWQVSTNGGVDWSNINDGATYTGALSALLRINNPLRTMNGWQYRVVVSGTCTPAVTSAAALLTVNTRPEILGQPSAVSICENTNTSFTVNAQGTAITYQWYVDQGGGAGWEILSNGGVYSGVTDATLNLTAVPRSYNGYRYRAEVSGTCLPAVNSTAALLNVTIETIINAQPADTAICEFNTATFRVVADGANLTYQWQVMNPGDVVWSNVVNGGKYIGANLPTLLVFNADRTMDGTRYQVVIGSTCSPALTSAVSMLTIYTAPEISSHPVEVTACPADNVNYAVTAAGTDLVYQWQVNMGGGFVNISDDATYTGTGSPALSVSNINLGMNGWLYRVVITGRCTPPTTSSFARLNVTPEPIVFQHPSPAEICANANTWFLTSVFIGSTETVQWEVNTGSGWNDVVNGAVYQGASTQQLILNGVPVGYNGYRYRLRIDAVCGTYYTNEGLLTVNSLPTALISASDTLDVCGGVTLPLNGNPAGGSGVWQQHRWTGDIGPLSSFMSQTTNFRTSIGGNYDLAYTVTDSKGCIGSDTVVVRVERPVAMFTASTTSGCTTLPVTFTNLSTDFASLVWDFGDGFTSTDDSPTHNFVNTTTTLQYYVVTLTVTSPKGCTDVRTLGITVYPETESTFTVSSDTICSGGTVTFVAQPGGFQYHWVYGDGSDQFGVNTNNHIYINGGTDPVTYTVTLTTTSFFGCTSTTSHTVVVYPQPDAEFTATPSLQTWPAALVNFNNLTNAGNWSYLWRFGDGNTSTAFQPSHTYGAPGKYNVTLIVRNLQCVDSVTRVVEIMPTAPIASFANAPSGCGPWTVNFSNTSQYATSYLWDFGDGGVSTSANPVYTWTVPGIYRVTLTAYGPGGVAIYDQILEVYPTPRAYFQFTPEKVYVNDERVRFFNLSQAADSYIWDFGDGDTSHQKDPFHKYLVKGIFDVTLHAYSNNGCYSSYTASPGVLVEPAGVIRFATAFIPSKDGPQTGVTPTPATIDQFFFPPVTEQVIKYKLQIFNRWGVLLFESNDINIGWDGYYKNKLVKQGVYVWIVEGKYANGRPFRKSGDVTVLH